MAATRDQRNRELFVAPAHQADASAVDGSHEGSNGANVVHLLDYVRVVYKRRWTAFTIFATVFLSITVYTFTTTPIFQANVQILIEKENANVVTFKEAFEQNQIADDYYQTQYKILQSRRLARRIIDTLRLWNHHQFNAARTRWAAVFELLKPHHGAEGPTETRAQSAVIDRFLENVSVSPIRNSRLVDVRFSSPDPRLAAQVANAIATGYIEQHLEFKFTASKEASDWLEARLAEQRKQVDASEQALQKYREQTEAVALDEKQNIVVQKLADLNAAVTRAKTERIQKEAAFNQIRDLQEDRVSLDTFPAILTNTFIQQQKSEIAELQRQQAQLSDKLGPKHPEMVKIANAIAQAEAKLQTEIAKIVHAVQNEYQSAVLQERTLTAALDEQKKDALALNRQGISYGALLRDASTNRQIFESLFQRMKETGIAGELRTSNIRIVDPAELPRKPSSPNAPANLLIALLTGSTLALALVFFFEYLDNRIKTPDEIRGYLGVPFLGMVPALFDDMARNPRMNNGVPSDFAESFRGIRTHLLFSNATDGSKSVVVTSSGPGEGKTVVASNLAIALAQASQRVLLIDADMRKSRVHAVFGQLQQPGLSNVLVGNAKASESVRHTDVPGLWVLPAGVNPPNPAELLGSKRFRDFVAMLGQHFDWLVIDTPPVMVVTDASVTANVAQGVVFVVGAEMTSRQVALHSVEQIRLANATFMGVILNRVDLAHHGYYYSEYYHREYGAYYTTSPTSPAA